MVSPTLTTPASPHSSGSGTTSRDVSFGATLDDGDGMYLLCMYREGTVTPPGGAWSDTFLQVQNNFSMRGLLFEASGGETTQALTTDSATVLMVYPIRIAAGTWDPLTPPEITVDISTADPPSETASWGADDNGWISANVNNSSGGTTGYPTGYGDNQRAHSSAFDQMHCAMATKQDAVATDNPTAFTIGSSPSRNISATIVFRGAAGVDLAQLSETDSLLALPARKSLPITIVSDTNASLPLSAVKALPIAQVSDTSEALAFSGSVKSQPLAQLFEADELLPLGASPEQPLAIVTETDSVIAIAGTVKSKPVDIVSETDSLFALTGLKRGPLGLMVETDLLLPLGTAVPLAILVEADQVLALLGGSLPFGGTAKATGLKVSTRANGLVPNPSKSLKAKSSGFRTNTRSSGLEIAV